MAQLKRNPDREFVLTRLVDLANTTDPMVVDAAIKGLAQIKDERAVAAISKLAGKAGFRRWRIARALGNTEHPSAVKYFENLMQPYVVRPYDTGNNGDEVILRLEIIAALARIPTPESRELLGKLEKDSLSSVSEAATAALKTVSPK